MLFRSYKPAAPLCEFVEDFWLYQNYAGEHARERILPSGTFEMVFNLNEDELRIYGMHEQDECRRYAGAVISGPYARSFTSDAAEETSIMGVHFKPGGAFPVLGIPAGEFTDMHVDLAAVWGRAAAELRERLSRATKPAERFRLLEHSILRRLCGRPMRRSAAGRAVEILLAADCGYFDQSHLIRDFLEFSGVSPADFWQRQRQLDRAAAHVKRHHLPFAE